MQASTRTATKADLPDILWIMNYAILHTTAVYDYEVKDEAFVQQWFTDKQQNNFPVIVAVVNGQVAGYGSYAWLKPKEGYKYCAEHSVYVSDEFQGQGIGRSLLTALISEAKLRNIHTMIGVIDADNTASIQLHEQLGFTEAGYLTQAGFKFNRWLNVIFMQIMLS